MVTLDQIKKLDSKVQKAVACITELKAENSHLQKNLEKYRKRIDELELLINEYKEDQTAIEEGIKNALLHLDKLEDSIAKPVSAGKAAPAAVRPEPASGPATTIEIDDVEGVPVAPDFDANAEKDETEDKPAKGPGELDIF
jgi:FtsZ-binding cell division protein ZapB